MFSVLNHGIYLNLPGLKKKNEVLGKYIHGWVVTNYDSYSFLSSM